MNRETDFFYLFYDRRSKHLEQLDLLSNYSESMSCRTADGDKYKLYGKYFKAEDEFIQAVSDFNTLMAQRYFEKFKILAPYRLECQLLFYMTGTTEYCIYISAYDRCYRFTYGKETPENFTEFARIRNIEPGTFNIRYMLNLHTALLNSVVFRAGYDRNKFCYTVNCGENSFCAHIEKSRARTGCYFLDFNLNISNGYVFEYYNVNRQNIMDLLTVNSWSGKWPEDVESTIYAIMQYMNRTYIANANFSFVIDDDAVMFNGTRYPFKQTKKGGWFLSGNIEKILQMFSLDSVDSLRKTAKLYLGAKNRPGVFPECDTKEELINLIKMFKDGERKFKFSSFSVLRSMQSDDL